jgi:hypothetical protein
VLSNVGNYPGFHHAYAAVFPANERENPTHRLRQLYRRYPPFVPLAVDVHEVRVGDDPTTNIRQHILL